MLKCSSYTPDWPGAEFNPEDFQLRALSLAGKLATHTLPGNGSKETLLETTFLALSVFLRDVTAKGIFKKKAECSTVPIWETAKEINAHPECFPCTISIAELGIERTSNESKSQGRELPAWRGLTEYSSRLPAPLPTNRFSILGPAPLTSSHQPIRACLMQRAA